MDFYFAQKTFFPKNLLPNSGCGLSTGAAYTRVNTVICGSAIFCILRGLIFNVVKDWSFLLDISFCDFQEGVFYRVATF